MAKTDNTAMESSIVGAGHRYAAARTGLSRSLLFMRRDLGGFGLSGRWDFHSFIFAMPRRTYPESKPRASQTLTKEKGHSLSCVRIQSLVLLNKRFSFVCEESPYL